MTTEQIQEMFDKITVPLNNFSGIKGMTFNGFHAAILKVEHTAYMQGLDDGMDKLMEAVEKGIETVNL